MFRKIVKIDPVKSRIFKVPPPLSGAVYIYGRIGSGKTANLLSISQKYHDKENSVYKILDLFGGHRNESLYWTLPSIDINYWGKVKNILGISEKQAIPKQYKVNILYPLFKKTMRKKLPDNTPWLLSS